MAWKTPERGSRRRIKRHLHIAMTLSLYRQSEGVFTKVKTPSFKRSLSLGVWRLYLLNQHRLTAVGSLCFTGRFLKAIGSLRFTELLLKALFRDGKHQLDAVFLIDTGSGGIVVDRDNIRDIAVQFAQAVDHTLAADVVGQAAKRLRADDVAVAAFDQLDHLGGEQPALTHLVAVADDVLNQRFQMVVGRRGRKLRVLGQHVEQDAFHAQQKIHKGVDGYPL